KSGRAVAGGKSFRHDAGRTGKNRSTKCADPDESIACGGKTGSRRKDRRRRDERDEDRGRHRRRRQGEGQLGRAGGAVHRGQAFARRRSAPGGKENTFTEVSLFLFTHTTR